MIQAISRFTFVIGGLLGGFAVTRIVDWQSELGLPRYYVIFLLIILGGAIGYVLGGIVGRELTTVWLKTQRRLPRDRLCGPGARHRRPRRRPQHRAAGIRPPAAHEARVAQRHRDGAADDHRRLHLRPAWRCLAVAISPPSSRGSPRPSSSPLASARCCSTPARSSTAGSSSCTGWASCRARLRVPRFVLSELQTLADSADDNRRARGRRGLDLLASLPAETSVEVFEADYPETAAGRRQAHAAGGRRQELDRDRRLQPREGRPGPRHRGPEPQRRRLGTAPDLPARREHPSADRQGRQGGRAGRRLPRRRDHGRRAGRPLVRRQGQRRRGDLRAADLGGQDDLRSRRRRAPRPSSTDGDSSATTEGSAATDARP